MSVRNGQQMSYLVNDIYTRILHRRTVGPFGMVSLCDGLDGLHICTCPLPTSGRPPLLPTTLIKISVLSPPPDRQQLVSELPNKNLNIISIWHKFNKITISNQFLKVCKYTYIYVCFDILMSQYSRVKKMGCIYGCVRKVIWVLEGGILAGATIPSLQDSFQVTVYTDRSKSVLPIFGCLMFVRKKG